MLHFYSANMNPCQSWKKYIQKWHLVTDHNRIWRRHKVMQSPNFGRSSGFTPISLPKSALIDENNLSLWTFMNETLQTLNYAYRGEIHFSFLNLVDEYASRIKYPRCRANLNYNKSKCSDWSSAKSQYPIHRRTPYMCVTDTDDTNDFFKTEHFILRDRVSLPLPKEGHQICKILRCLRDSNHWQIQLEISEKIISNINTSDFVWMIMDGSNISKTLFMKQRCEGLGRLM